MSKPHLLQQVWSSDQFKIILSIQVDFPTENQLKFFQMQ